MVGIANARDGIVYDESGIELPALVELARSHRVAFRAESTVMSGTPVLSTLTAGLAGAVPAGVRGPLNATTNAIRTRMTEGLSYPEALAEAVRRSPNAILPRMSTVPTQSPS